MILFNNGLIVLNYEPATDILSVDMPTVNNLNVSEIGGSLSIIVDHVRNYDVKRLLVDARSTVVDIDEDTYTAIVSEFSRNLLTTRIQKVARIVTTSTVRENVVQKVYGNQNLPIEFKSFTEITPALEWLKV